MSTANRDELLTQFVSITGAEMSEALEYLQATNWNVDISVQRFFNKGAAPISQPMAAPIRAPDKAQWDTLAGGAGGNAHSFAPVVNGYGKQIGHTVAKQEPFRDYSKEWGGKGDKKSTDLGNLFKPPDFVFKGTLEEACAKAEQEKKWLLVNVQNCQEFTSHTLNRDVWNDETISEIVKANFIFYQRDDNSKQGIKLVSFYKIGKFPYLAILDPRTRAEIYHFVKKLTQNQIQEEFFMFLDKHGSLGEKTVKPAPPRSQLVSQAPVVEDDDWLEGGDDEMMRRAIAASLEGNEEEKDEVLDWASDSEPLEDENDGPPPIPKVVDEPEAGAKDSTRIRVRMADGKTNQRRFLSDHALQEIHNWCAGVMGTTKFSLMQPYPRKVFESNEMGRTLKELGLENSQLICKLPD